MEVIHEQAGEEDSDGDTMAAGPMKRRGSGTG